MFDFLTENFYYYVHLLISKIISLSPVISPVQAITNDQIILEHHGHRAFDNTDPIKIHELYIIGNTETIRSGDLDIDIVHYNDIKIIIKNSEIIDYMTMILENALSVQESTRKEPIDISCDTDIHGLFDVYIKNYNLKKYHIYKHDS